MVMLNSLAIRQRLVAGGSRVVKTGTNDRLGSGPNVPPMPICHKDYERPSVPTIAAPDLTGFVISLLTVANVPHDDAVVVANSLVGANLAATTRTA